DAEHARRRQPPGQAAPPGGGGRGGVLEEVGDRGQLVDAGQGEPGGGVVRLCPGGRRGGRRLGRRQRVGHHGFGLGDDLRLHLGVRVEQRVDGRQLVDVVGQRQPGGGVVRLGARRRRRDHRFERGEVDGVGREVDDGRRLFQQRLDRRQRVRIGDR